MVALSVVALTLAATGGAATPSVTALKVTYWPNGANESVRKTWTLRCNPAGGTVARLAVACNKLAAGGRKLFAPVPRAAVCTEIYGGPDRARVTGVVAPIVGARTAAQLAGSLAAEDLTLPVEIRRALDDVSDPAGPPEADVLDR